MRTKLILVVILFSLVVAQGYPPRPPAIQQVDIPFTYDPNMVKGEILRYELLRPGELYEGQIKCTEPDGDIVAVTISDAPTELIFPLLPDESVLDPNCPYGIAIIYTYNFEWTPSESQLGVHYLNFIARDPQGKTDERAVLLFVKPNEPPVFIGCSRR